MQALSKSLSIVLLAATMLPGGRAYAQETGSPGPKPPAADPDGLAHEMAEAEERLADAARRVAELSAERLDQFDGARKFVYEVSDRPRLGVNIETDGATGPVEGVGVMSVTPGSAADEAGLRSGDVITSIDGESLSAASQQDANRRLLDVMRGVKEGDSLKLEYLRDGKVAGVDIEPRSVTNNLFVWTPDGADFTLPRTPEVHPAPKIVDRFRYSFGGWRDGWGDMEVVELTEGLGRYFGTSDGMLVISAPRSNDFRLQEGDVIQSIDGRKPGSVDHCMRILASYQPGETLELRIMRDRKAQTIQVSIPARPETQTGSLAPVRPLALPARLPLPAPVERIDRT